jgi:hypothetical protein
MKALLIRLDGIDLGERRNASRAYGGACVGVIVLRGRFRAGKLIRF